MNIDEKSLSEFGRWPWNRVLQAELIEKVVTGNPRVVAVDIFYPESESPESDARLAEVFSRNRERLVIALGFEAADERAFNGEVSDRLFDHAILRIENLSLLHSAEAFRVLLPSEPITGSAPFGHVYSLADQDGKLRWENLYLKYGDEYFPSLALQTARIYNGLSLEKLIIYGGTGVALGDVFIPTDTFGRLPINYLGKEGTIRTVSAADVLAGRISSEVFEDRVVFIGTTAIATYDLKNTPFSANFPGVEKNATVTSNIISRSFITKSPLVVDLGVIVLTGLAALFIGRRKRASVSIFIYVSLTVLLIVSNVGAFALLSYRMNLSYPLLLVVFSGSTIIGYQYYIEELSARNIRRMFSSYVTERVVNELIRNPDMAHLGGERREITVLFSDIRDFTSFSEKNPPEEVVAVLNEYLGAMTEVVFKWEGTIDKFVGDAVVAFWGAPLAQEDHAERALRCALHMIGRLGELRQKWLTEGKKPLDIGIGINTGEAIVGNIGAEGKKMEYTVIGDTVNLCARIEPLTKKYGTRIIISEFSLAKIRELIERGSFGHVCISGLEKVLLRGKEIPVEVFEFRSTDTGTVSVITECRDTAVRAEEK